MRDLICLLTCTRDREKAIQLLSRWIGTQKAPEGGGLAWVVLDTGDKQSSIPKPPNCETFVHEHRLAPSSASPHCNFAATWAEAFRLVPSDAKYVMVMDDDDYYAPSYVKEMLRMLIDCELAGFCRQRYYHLPSGGYKILTNEKDAALATTGFRRGLLQAALATAEQCARIGNFSIDRNLWGICRFEGSTWRKRLEPCGRIAPRPLPLSEDPLHGGPSLHVGMKGLPGLPGIGRGHDPKIYDLVDEDGVVLEAWMGKQPMEAYRKLLTPI